MIITNDGAPKKHVPSDEQVMDSFDTVKKALPNLGRRKWLAVIRKNHPNWNIGLKVRGSYSQA